MNLNFEDVHSEEDIEDTFLSTGKLSHKMKKEEKRNSQACMEKNNRKWHKGDD